MTVFRSLLATIASALVMTSAAAGRSLAEIGRSIREGDIIFTGGKDGQGAAIIQATGSPVTHCGVAVAKDGSLQVLEAIQPVKYTPVADFLARSGHSLIGVFRLKTPLPAEFRRKSETWGARQIGKNYDRKFLWNNKKMYCSELVWKLYEKSGVRLCEPRRFKDYFLERPAVLELIRARFGGRENLPEDELVVAPSDLAASPALVKVE